ncbi:unnamed protein product [Rhizoctonia solani]|uniref:Uncharacterized protein n=1 Tax=Rhizoctonia solani TaxID=456999 RepID=A0A8H3GWI9_9AGAM|nr:unnamed protein product [Rhizoctonia solani]CAE7057490.1 unnamed protein product [Rhizoctonia solani]
MVLDITTRKNREESYDGAPSSLQVHTDWILSNLKGADEVTGPSKDSTTKEDETCGGEGSKATHIPTGDDSNAKDPDRLIREVMIEIKKDFESLNGPDSELNPHGLGIGDNLSELMKKINRSEATKNKSNESTFKYERKPDQGSPIRDKRPDGVEATGKPAP